MAAFAFRLTVLNVGCPTEVEREVSIESNRLFRIISPSIYPCYPDILSVSLVG